MAKGLVYKSDPNTAIKEFVKLLIEHENIQGALLYTKMEHGGSYTHILTRKKEDIDNSCPIPPVMPVQTARVVSKLTKRGPLNKAVVVVARPCELRAIRELSKINQVDYSSIITVSHDCCGVYPTKIYLNNPDRIEEAYPEQLSSFSIENKRPLCEGCELFTGDLADFEVQFANLSETVIIARTERARNILESLNKAEEVQEHPERLNQEREKRKVSREKFLREFGEQVNTPEKLLNILSSCINCHNCRSVCPICFCRECFFDSDALKVPSHLYIERASRKGGLRFLPDTLLFHLGRMNHMSLSCVSCGSCEDACPNMVPVSRLFSLVSENTRAIFGYIPGVNLEEPSPFLEYREEELEEYEVPYRESLAEG